MTNHVHVLLTPLAADGLPRTMQLLALSFDPTITRRVCSPLRLAGTRRHLIDACEIDLASLGDDLIKRGGFRWKNEIGRPTVSRLPVRQSAIEARFLDVRERQTSPITWEVRLHELARRHEAVGAIGPSGQRR